MIRSQLAIVSLFFLAAQTKAQDPHAAQPERPTVATHAGTVAPGWTELEAGAEFDDYADQSRGLVTPILLKTGLAPRVQLSIQALLVRALGESATEIGDLFVGVKWRLAEDAPVVAFLGGPTFEMHKWLVLDAGVIVPIAGPQPRALYSGLTWNIGRLWRASRQ